MVFNVQLTKCIIMTFAIWRREGPCIDGGLEQGGTIPFFIGDVCRNFAFSTFFSEKQISYYRGVIAQLIPGPMSKYVVPHGFESLTQSNGELIQYIGGIFEIIQLLVRKGLQSHTRRELWR